MLIKMDLNWFVLPTFELQRSDKMADIGNQHIYLGSNRNELSVIFVNDKNFKKKIYKYYVII